MIEQRTEEWHQARLGRVTASRMSDVMGRTKSGYGAGRANYMAALIVERLTQNPVETYSNAAMQWGTETEPQARATYMLTTGRDVAEAGFDLHPTIADLGASPDGYVGDDGLIEIKCPNTATHLDTLLSDAVPQKYLLQMQTQMACTGRAWCDFVSFDPRLPDEMQMWIKRIPRDAALIAEIEAETVKFLGEMTAKLAALRARYQEAAA